MLNGTPQPAYIFNIVILYQSGRIYQADSSIYLLCMFTCMYYLPWAAFDTGTL